MSSARSGTSGRGQQNRGVIADLPNIVFVHTDQQHHKALSAYGNRWIRTPCMDRVVAEGVSFMHTVVASPVCSSSRAAWFTGRMARESGVAANSYPLAEHIPDLGQWLSKHTDYDVVHAGKWHVPSRNVRTSFSVLHPGHDQGEVGDSDTARAGLAWLLNRKSERPFFLSIGLHNPHDACYLGWAEGGPYKFDYAGHIADELPPLPESFDAAVAGRGKTADWSTRDWRYYLYNYLRMTEMVDAEVGRLHEAVRRSPFSEDTIFVLASDHGDHIGHQGRIGKGLLYDAACRVPLVISWPGHFDEGRRDDEHLVSLIDLPATFCDLAGAPALPDATQPRSLRPLLEGQEGVAWREFSVAESAQGPISVAIWDRRFKSVISSAGARLYDLGRDPLEQRDLASDPAHASVLGRHRRHLKSYAAEIDCFRAPKDMSARIEADRKHRGKRRQLYSRGDIYTPIATWYDALASGAR